MHQTIGRIAGKPGDYKKCPTLEYKGKETKNKISDKNENKNIWHRQTK